LIFYKGGGAMRLPPDGSLVFGSAKRAVKENWGFNYW
jgi:hypothetical protein